MSANLLNLPEQLGAVVLKWAAAKYIEAAGSTSQAMLARAQTVKAIAAELTGVAAGTITIAQLQTMAASEMAAKGLSISNQILLQGLVNLVSSNLPVGGGLLQAAISADVSLFLSDVSAVATSFGA